MIPSVFEFFVLSTALLTVAVLLRRLARVEEDRARLDAKLRSAGRIDDEEQEALRAIGVLTNELCHLVISPLTIILGQCELARSGGERTRRIETIERQARRIAAVVETLAEAGEVRRGDEFVALEEE